MRKMTDGKTVINVHEWIIVGSSFWEYYVTEKWSEDNCAYCLVDGDFQEVGLVSYDEIKPYISAKTRDLQAVQPARGWAWLGGVI